jgi:predicted transcriptional regulator
MNTTELKESIIQKIRSTNDEGLLDYLNQLLTSNEGSKKYKQNESRIGILAESRADYLAGQSISKKDLQTTLYSRILAITDEESLLKMISLIDQNDKTIYHTTPEQKDAIRKGRQQISSDQFFTNEQVEKEIDEWLSKE